MKLQITDAWWGMDAEGDTVTFRVKNGQGADARSLVDDVRSSGKKLFELACSVFYPKRSLRANRYAWELIGKIADVLRAGKDEIYLKMLKRYGQSDLVSALADVPVEFYFKYYEEAGESVLNGKNFKHYRVYKGSSEFDSREMAVFIDGIISEAKDLGIQTETPDEVAKMKALWDQR